MLNDLQAAKELEKKPKLVIVGGGWGVSFVGGSVAYVAHAGHASLGRRAHQAATSWRLPRLRSQRCQLQPLHTSFAWVDA